MRINSTLYYVLTDHLGSASVVTNASGSIVGEQGYYPFGETRFTTGTMYTDKLYTGQREITGLGIYHYNARFYSPKLGRFLSADTIVPGFANPQNLNRYSYVNNNPLRYTDPTGHFCTEEDADGNIINVNCGTGLPPNSGGSGGGGGSSHDDDEDNETVENPVNNIINPGTPIIISGGYTLYSVCHSWDCSHDTTYTLSWYDAYSQLEQALHVLSTGGYSPGLDVIEDLVMATLDFNAPSPLMLVEGIQAAFNENYDALYLEVHQTNVAILEGNPDINQSVEVHIVTGLWTSTDPNNGSEPGITWVYETGQGYTGNAVGIPGGMTDNIENLLLQIISP